MRLRVARLLGGTPEVWMRLQASYDLRAKQDVIQRVPRIVPVKALEEARG